MKKVVVLVLASALAALILCACKLGECTFCGKKGLLSERTFLGVDVYLCSDCNG